MNTSNFSSAKPNLNHKLNFYIDKWDCNTQVYIEINFKSLKIGSVGTPKIILQKLTLTEQSNYKLGFTNNSGVFTASWQS